MRARPVPGIVLMMLASGAWAFGCQLLYDKHELTVASDAGTTGGGGTTTSTSTTGGAGGTTTSVTSSTGGATTASTGGAGGATTTSTGGATTTSTGGTGGSTTTSTGTGGDLDGGTDGDASDGPDCSGDRLFLIGTSASGVLCGTFAPMSGWTSTTSASASSNERPAAALLDAKTGVGVFFQGGATGPLRAIELTNGACGAPADVLAVTTKAAPSAAVLGGKVQTLFQGAVGAGTDHPFVAAWDPITKWAAPAQIDVNVFSPAPSGVAASGSELLAVYAGGDDNVYRVRFLNGAWQLPAVSFKTAGGVNSEQTNKALTPGVTGLDAGGWLVVFEDKASGPALRWLTTDGPTNAPSQPLAGALSDSPVALAKIEGGAVLAFRGTDSGVYAATFDAVAGTWSSIVDIGGSVTTLVSPAVTAGVCTHRAELAFVDAADGSIKHASLEGATWSAPVSVGGTGMKGVAIAGSP